MIKKYIIQLAIIIEGKLDIKIYNINSKYQNFISNYFSIFIVKI